ncbi:hypothetical protein C8J57DRAFT_1458924 [Mycena rebaudengoi]|nr:hypothetical protein C8J57DRAFT_1458924 [Mycena rebaudengoi]
MRPAISISISPSASRRGKRTMTRGCGLAHEPWFHTAHEPRVRTVHEPWIRTAHEPWIHTVHEPRVRTAREVRRAAVSIRREVVVPRAPSKPTKGTAPSKRRGDEPDEWGGKRGCCGTKERKEGGRGSGRHTHTIAGAVPHINTRRVCMCIWEGTSARRTRRYASSGARQARAPAQPRTKTKRNENRKLSPTEKEKKKKENTLRRT